MKRIKTIVALKKGLLNTFKTNIPLPKNAITNQRVRDTYLDAIKNSRIINSANLSLIEKLVDRGIIVPIECTDDYIRELNKKLKGKTGMNPREYEHVLGFFTGTQNKIFILMDHIRSHLPNDCTGMYLVTLHELQHMCCNNFPRQFISTWANELFTFYGYFLAALYAQYMGGFNNFMNKITGKEKDIFDKLKDAEYGVDYLIQYMIYNHEMLWSLKGMVLSSKDCMNLGAKMSAICERCGVPEDVSMKIYHAITDFMYDALTGNIDRRIKSGDNFLVFTALRIAYFKMLKGIDITKHSFIYQEILFPSEVICMMSKFKYSDSRFFKFLNNL